MQVELGLPSIGGKDSMSGTFQHINVPPMLMAFGITTVNAGRSFRPISRRPAPYLPGAPYAQGEPYARHGAAEGQLRLCQRKISNAAISSPHGRWLRRCRRRSCQDGFRQPHRRRGGDGRGGTLRIRLWFDPCRERRRTDPSCGRAAGYDRSRRGVDRQRRENAARRPLQGQYREIRGRLPRTRGRTMPE